MNFRRQREKKKSNKNSPIERSHRGIILRIVILLLLTVSWLWSWVPVTEVISLDLSEDSRESIWIALITDLHSCFYGKEQSDLMKRIDKGEPDVIILAGDIFDDVQGDDNAKALIEQLVRKYPCYYTTGNHEYWSGRTQEIKDYLREQGVYVLAGDCEKITINGYALDICGVDDPDYLSDQEWQQQISRAYADTEEAHIKILVSHRPEKVSVYQQYDFDLVLTGHAHGGQIGIPFIDRGLFAPDQGFGAEYVSGSYELSNGSIMVVSRGLARESTPLPRYFNHPEIVMLELD